MTESQARQIGGQFGVFSMGIGLLIACLECLAFPLFLVLAGKFQMGFYLSIFMGFFFWFAVILFLYHVLFGTVVMVLFAYLLGQKAGKSILINGRNPILTGIVMTFLVLIITGFLCGGYGFFEALITGNDLNSTLFVQQVVKPMKRVAIIGFIPATIAGIWFGSRVKRQGNTNLGIIFNWQMPGSKVMTLK